MRTLVTGAAGFVGRQLAHELNTQGHTVGVTVYENDPDLPDVATFSLDIREKNSTFDVVKASDPDVVFHLAAISDADACEQNPELAYTVNVDGTEHLATACERCDAKLVFLSSSFVFSGEADIYHEDDSRSPVNIYGETKIAAEDVVSEADCASLVIRTDQPYGWAKSWQPPCMVKWVIEQLDANDSVPVFADWWNKPIYNPDLTAAIRALIQEARTGVFHVVGPEFLNRYDWARQIASVFGYDPVKIERSLAKGASLPAERPNARLSTEKLRQVTDIAPRNIDEGLKQIASR